mmetsp:Transcript_13786/g.43632  ORF Transcript_13786/g.43632 Transcript_13786/m.43632 type:complete len:156 (-) Transcript_13786:288-755(-)
MLEEKMAAIKADKEGIEASKAKTAARAVELEEEQAALKAASAQKGEVARREVQRVDAMAAEVLGDMRLERLAALAAPDLAPFRREDFIRRQCDKAGPEFMRERKKLAESLAASPPKLAPKTEAAKKAIMDMILLVAKPAIDAYVAEQEAGWVRKP